MICRNSEYYADPTAGKAIANVMREQEEANGKIRTWTWDRLDMENWADLEYRYLCYMRFTKIAEVLNYGESTIRVWHQKGLERLESFLNPDENLAENSGK